MSKSTLHYSPGDWIAVPLEGGWAVGLIVRMGEYGACLGYFFGPLLRDLPKVEQLSDLRPEQAIFIRRFLSAQLEDGEWPVLGRLPDWDPKLWPVPSFRFNHPITKKWLIRSYDDDLNFLPDRSWVTEEEVRGLPEDGTSYGGALQLYLAELLGTKADVVDPFATLTATTNEPPQHYLYFHDKDLAEHAAEDCRKLGYAPILQRSADENLPWLVLVRHKSQTTSEEEMEQAAARLSAVADEWAGEYDGWDKPGWEAN